MPLLSLKWTKPSDSSIELWPEQENAVSYVCDHAAVALFFEQRTGKTYITLGVIERLERSTFAGVLVCLLNNKDSTWRDKIAEFLPWLNVTSDWEEYKALPFPKLLLVHFESLHTVAKKIQKVKWINFVAVDEAHRLKDRGSRQSRAAAKLYQPWRRRIIMTGTPIEKQPKDLWAQFRVIEPSLFGSWRSFEDEFLDVARIDMSDVKPGTARWQMKIMQQGMLRKRAPFREEKMADLVALIEPYAIRLTKREVGILPPKIIKRLVTIDGNQRRYYDRMKKHSVIRLATGERSMATMNVTNIVKRRQIASGFVYDDDGIAHHLGSAKLDALVALFDRLPKPVVVFAVFKPEIDAIVDRLKGEGYDIAVVTGSTKKKDRPQIWRDFQRAQYDGIVCQTRVGGVGVDLWKANYAIAHSISHSSIDFDQMKARLDAKHKRKASKIYLLCGDATIDVDLYDMVVEKGLSSEEVLKRLKKGAQ